MGTPINVQLFLNQTQLFNRSSALTYSPLIGCSTSSRAFTAWLHVHSPSISTFIASSHHLSTLSEVIQPRIPSLYTLLLRRIYQLSTCLNKKNPPPFPTPPVVTNSYRGILLQIPSAVSYVRNSGTARLYCAPCTFYGSTICHWSPWTRLPYPFLCNSTPFSSSVSARFVDVQYYFRWQNI